jgi:hypothetical protein
MNKLFIVGADYLNISFQPSAQSRIYPETNSKSITPNYSKHIPKNIEIKSSYLINVFNFAFKAA